MTHDQRKQENAQYKAVLALADAITEAVNSLPNGIPAGHLYATMMQYMTLDQFNMIMSTLVKTKKIRKQGLLYLAGLLYLPALDVQTKDGWSASVRAD